MGEAPKEQSKASCLTAASTITVAAIGACATIIAALITVLNKQPQPAPSPQPVPAVTGSPLNVAPTPTGRTRPVETPTPTPEPPPPAPSLEGVYVLQGQNVAPPMSAQMTLTQVDDGQFRWRTEYVYAAYPNVPLWSEGELVNQGGQWILSLRSSNEPNAVPYDRPVRINFARGVLVIALDQYQGMTWRKR